MSNVLRNVPSVHDLLDSPPLKSLARRLSQNVVVTHIGRFLEGMRSQMQSAASAMHVPTPAELAQRIADWIAAEQQSDVRPVINATGILLHAGLGGPPLAAEAIQATTAVAGNYTAVDLDLATGEHMSRTRSIERQITRLTEAEAATVVNNQAGAAVLTLAALAREREVVVARGQLVEIPGSHRLPDVVSASGALLREVGTTNCTRVADYAAAIGDRTAALFHVHTSVRTAAEQPTLVELADLAHRHKRPLVTDLGAGSLVDLNRYGVAGISTIDDALRAGADLVLVGGCPLGGPTCGLIVGRRALVALIENHPLMPTLRADKLTIAALAATLRLYQDPALAERAVPLLSLLASSVENLKNRAERLAPQIAATGVAQAEIIQSEARYSDVDSPSKALASYALSLRPTRGSAQSLMSALRTCKSPVLGRTEGGRVVLDLRTVLPRQDAELVAAIEELAAPQQPTDESLDVPTVV